MAVRIRKIDYYVGALLSHIVNNKIAPAIFDSSDSSKIITFATDNEDYNLFLKYSSKPAKEGKDYSRWDIQFTDSEYDVVKTYSKEKHKNLVVLVCSKEGLTNTEIAVIEASRIPKLLGEDTVNQNRRITVKAIKGSKFLRVYGTALKDTDAITIFRNLEKHFITAK